MSPEPPGYSGTHHIDGSLCYGYRVCRHTSHALSAEEKLAEFRRVFGTSHLRTRHTLVAFDGRRTAPVVITNAVTESFDRTEVEATLARATPLVPHLTLSIRTEEI